jgi:hypothetical protein
LNASHCTLFFYEFLPEGFSHIKFLMRQCLIQVLGNSGKYITLETSKSDSILKVCFSGAGNSRIQEVWDLRSLEFADVQSSGNLVRRRDGVVNMRKPGISTVGGPNFGDFPIRESSEDSVRDSGAGTRANLRRSESHFGNLLKT